MTDSVTDRKVNATQKKIIAQLDARAAYEHEKNADNASIQKTIAELASFAHEHVARAFCIANVDLSIINRQQRVNARTNVYALQKLFADARVCANVITAKVNHYSKHIVLSAASFAEADTVFTRDDASYSCSNVHTHSDKAKARLINRYDSAIADNTVTTQLSSSIESLIQMSVLEEFRTDSNKRAYRICDNENAQNFLSACNK